VTDQLRHALNALASEVEVVDLRQRVHATTRRLAMRHATAAAAGVAVLVGATAITAVRVFATEEGAALPGAVEASASCAVAEPRGPWRDPGDWATLTPVPSIDELFYLAREPARDTGVLRLVSWQPGMEAPVPRCELRAEAAKNANVSPDGRWVTWVSDDGALHIADLTGRENDRILRRDVDGERLAPVWSPDARRLIVRDVSAGVDRAVVGVIDIANGRFTRLRHNLPDARYLVWSADGTAIAFVTPDGGLVVADPDGSRQQPIQHLDEVLKGRGVVGLQSLSGPTKPDDTRWLAITVGDPGAGAGPRRSLVGNAMINTKNELIDGTVRVINDYTERQAFFRNEPDQGMHSHVLRRLQGTRGIELIGGNGEYWGGGDEPAALAGFDLMGA
jgi:hypothetical protein